MLTTVSGDLFKAALRKCGGIFAEGESISADVMEDTRTTFNTMMDAWSAERLSVYAGIKQILTWPAGYGERTIGPSGNLIGTRPMHPISAFFRISNIDYPLEPMTSEDYDSIPQKTTSATHPEFIYVGQNIPNAVVNLYPVPSSNLELHLSSVAELLQVADLFTNITLPPGYQRAIIYNLAVEMCVEFGMEAPTTTKRIATFSKRAIRAQNSPEDMLEIPVIMLGKSRFNINTGE